MAGDMADLSTSTFSYPWQLPTSKKSFFLSLEMKMTLALLFTVVVVTSNKFITGVVVTYDICSLVSLSLVINLSLMLTTPVITENL
jgi:hypothetical protein